MVATVAAGRLLEPCRRNFPTGRLCPKPSRLSSRPASRPIFERRACRFGRFARCRLRPSSVRLERFGALAASIGPLRSAFVALAPSSSVLAMVCYGAPVEPKP